MCCAQKDDFKDCVCVNQDTFCKAIYLKAKCISHSIVFSLVLLQVAKFRFVLADYIVLT